MMLVGLATDGQREQLGTWQRGVSPRHQQSTLLVMSP